MTGAVEAGGDDPIPVGVLRSLSGTMAISEVSVCDAELLAIEEINAAGGLSSPAFAVLDAGQLVETDRSGDVDTEHLHTALTL